MIHRAEHKNNYTIVSNAVIRDKRLTVDAFRVLMYSLACNDAYEFSIDGLAYSCDMCKSRVMNAVKLLKSCGYIEQKRIRDDKKIVGCVWDIYEEPTVSNINSIENQQCCKSTVLKSNSVENQQCRNMTLSLENTNYIENTKYIESNKEKKETHGEFSRVLLTPSEYSKLIDKLGKELTEQYISTLDAYLEDHPRKHYASHYTTILNWQRKDGKKPKATTQPLKGSGNPFLDLLENMEADE